MDASNKKYYPFFILAGIFVILLIRNRYSFCWSDESLYVSNMYRLYQGDVFLKDEWNSAMLSSYVTLPLFYIFMLFKGSTDGVYIFFQGCLRCHCVFCSSIRISDFEQTVFNADSAFLQHMSHDLFKGKYMRMFLLQYGFVFVCFGGLYVL